MLTELLNFICISIQLITDLINMQFLKYVIKTPNSILLPGSEICGHSECHLIICNLNSTPSPPQFCCFTLVKRSFFLLGSTRD
jgi:hypothetical protein